MCHRRRTDVCSHATAWHASSGHPGNAGSDHLEEAAGCCLQIVLADGLDTVGRERIMRGMDAWGYRFRLCGTASWFRSDAEDALNWLIANELLHTGGTLTMRSRS